MTSQCTKFLRTFIFVALVALVAPVAIFGALATDNTAFADTDAEPISFYDEGQKPIFYGAAEITLSKNAIAAFDPDDARFRVFAKDYEDGDLTPKIVCKSNTVSPSVPGKYEVSYSVTDSHGNVADLVVPVTVTEEEGSQISVIRSIYAIPAMKNLTLTGTERCNNGDRQILGIFLPADSSAWIRAVDSDKDLQITFFTNTKTQNSFATVSAGSEEYSEIKNLRDGVSYDSVPLVTSPRLSEEKIDKIYRVELRFDASAKPLDYYHYKDDEQEFKTVWRESKNAFGVVDGEACLAVVPFADIDKITDYRAPGYNTPIGSIDDFLEYILTAVNRMDEMIGLSFDPDIATDRNYRTKYTIAADYSSNAGAYYAGNYIAVCNSSVAPVFQYGWGTLHEIAHGYQGSLGKGIAGGQNLCLNETGNNVLAYYIQRDKSVYKAEGSWVGGSLADIEKERNKLRFTDDAIFHNNSGTYTYCQEKLYFIINLLEAFEGETTYGKLFSYYRAYVAAGGGDYTVPEIYALFFAKEYGVNILPYLSAWKLTVGSDVAASIFSDTELTQYVVLSDAVSDDELEAVKVKLSSELDYAPVSADVLDDARSLGTLEINISVDDPAVVKNKPLLLFDRGRVAQSVVIDDMTLSLTVKPGVYELRFPQNYDYMQEYAYCYVSVAGCTVNYSYLRRDPFDYATKMELRGIYGTVGYSVSFDDYYRTATIYYGGSDLGNRNSYWEALPEETYASVHIFDCDGNIVQGVEVKGNHYFCDYTLSEPTVALDYGYKIKIHYEKPQLIRVVSLCSGNILSAYGLTSDQKDIEYVVTGAGIVPSSQPDFDAATVLYADMSAVWIKTIEEGIAGLTEADIADKNIKTDIKREIITAYECLNSSDADKYSSVIAAIKKGGSPRIEVLPDMPVAISETELSELDERDYRRFFAVVDAEDYVIDSSSGVCSFSVSGDKQKLTVTFSVKDSDNNYAEKSVDIAILSDSNADDGQLSGEGGYGQDAIADNTLAAIIIAVVLVLAGAVGVCASMTVKHTD